MRELHRTPMENMEEADSEERCLQRILKKNYEEVKELPEVKDFITDPKNKMLLTEASKKGELKTINKLNLAFQDFQSKVRRAKALKYAVGIIKRYPIDYDKRVNKRNNRNLLILDKPVKNNGEYSTTLMVELIQDSNHEEEMFSRLYQSNTFNIKDERLEQAFYSLPHSQQQLLILRYSGGYSQREISNMIGQTEQNIYYWHKKTIKQLQRKLAL